MLGRSLTKAIRGPLRGRVRAWHVRAALAALLTSALPATLYADYRLELTGTGKRDYYCTITVALINDTDAALTEINGFFLSYIDQDQVGRSKGASFRDVAPGGRAEAVFETPNAPCEDVTRYDFVIGACRLDIGFEDKMVCVDRMDLAPPFGDTTPLN